MKNERRKSARYIVPEDGFQVFSHKCKIVGKVKNISKGGLAYQYAPSGGVEKESQMIDILASGPGQFHLSGIACQTIYDILVLAQDQAFTGTETRIRGLQFVKLARGQKDRLDFLLEHYVTEPSNNLRIS